MTPKGPKRPQNYPKTTSRGVQEGQKRDPERQDEKRIEPRRSQDRLGSLPGPIPAVRACPWGVIWEAKSAPKSTPKRSKIEAKNQESKKPIQDDLGLVLGRSWAVLGAILGRLGPQNRALALGGARFFENSLFRC